MPYLTRRSLIIGMALLSVAACATRPPSPLEPTKPITLITAFKGKTQGVGVFKVPIAGIERRFVADLDGKVAGNVLTVRENFRFDDGEVQNLTWVFARSQTGEWQGKRDDTVGVAKVVEAGTEIRLDYVADVRSRGEVTRLGFSDVIYREAGGLVINRAIVKRFGIPVGTVQFELRRRG